MKKWKWIVAAGVLCITCTACGGNTEEQEVEESKTEESVSNETEENEEFKTYSLASETEDVSIEIGIPAIFEETEYSSDSWLAMQIPGNDEDSSVQLMMYLEADESVDVSKSMTEEVNYLLSANSDDEVQMLEQIAIQADHYEWSYITYVLEGLEGFKFFANLENGCTIAGTVENIGNDSESFNIDEFIHQIDETIVIE